MDTIYSAQFILKIKPWGFIEHYFFHRDYTVAYKFVPGTKDKVK